LFTPTLRDSNFTYLPLGLNAPWIFQLSLLLSQYLSISLSQYLIISLSHSYYSKLCTVHRLLNYCLQRPPKAPKTPAMPPIPPSPPIKLAILDDYQGIAARYFESLKSRFDITVFQDTLLPYNQAPENIKQELEARLKPFVVISAMRERTPFPATLLAKLPNLKLIVTTGHRNASIDMTACKSLGIKVTGSGANRHKPLEKQQNPGPDGTTQHTISLILGLARNLAHDDLTVKQGGWQTLTNTDLAGKTLAILGLGRLGVNVSLPFKSKIL